MGLKLTSSARTTRYEAAGFWGEGCLHDFLARNALISPKAPALVDPPDRETFTQNGPVTLNTAETLYAVEQLRLVFDQMGLQPGDLLAIQLPQIVEAPIAILAASRAGLMVCLLPPHWGRRETLAALGPVAPRAVLSWAGPQREGQARLEALRDIAAKLPSIRFLLAIGDDVPDGIVPLGAFASDARKRAMGRAPGDGTEGGGKPKASDPSDANDVVVVTWPSAGATNVRALARSHNELKATGLGIVNAAGLQDGARALCPFPLASYPAMAAFFVPWLLCQGCLVFHRAFDLGGFKTALAEAPTAFTAIPAQIESQVLAALADHPAGATAPDCLGIMRDPRVASSHAEMPQSPAPPLLDILNLNDLALHAELRTATGQISIPNTRAVDGGARPPPLIETHLAPPRPDDAPGAAELFIRSPMTPSAAVGGDAEGEGGGVFSALQDADGFVAAGLLARKVKRRFVPSASTPSGQLAHGGLRLDLADLKSLYAAWPPAANVKIDVVADAIMGSRLAVTMRMVAGSAPATAEQFCAFLHAQGAGAHMIPDEIRLLHEPASELREPTPAPEDNHIKSTAPLTKSASV
ncbi:hypothetical protein MNBD_ALPHA09-1359 [hydrothermal vent metagenome]|uniref:AMP-dependent synthetase/ligase domain-containing protein n=1 Tax=hydrothermal vent metagenome TaxID=652676 RepID=A0A3B0TAI0_9ZZZZ